MPSMELSGSGLLGGRFELMAPAGGGGMATVWRARDVVLGRQVAVKLLKEEHAGDQLRREAQAVARLNHPHVAVVHDFVEVEAPEPPGTVRCFVVMEFVDGRTVDDVLADSGPLPWRQATAIAGQVASALTAAHAHGVIHRDISGANIMVTDATDAGAKILDFGIAVTADRQGGDDADGVLGTTAYLAPELLRGKGEQPTAAVDVYGLGVVWYRMLTGAMPWAANTETDLLKAHLVYAPAPLTRPTDLPAPLANLCLACLAKNPADRPTSAELSRQLGSFLSAPPPATTLATGIVHRRAIPRRKWVAGLVTAAFLITAGIAWHVTSLLSGSTPADPSAPVFTAPSAGASPTRVAPARSAVAVPRIPAGPVARSRPATGSPVQTGTAPARPGVTVTALGGSVEAVCDGTLATATAVTTARGYQIKDHNPGPATEIKTVLQSKSNESEIKIRCPDGNPTGKVKESGR